MAGLHIMLLVERNRMGFCYFLVYYKIVSFSFICLSTVNNFDLDVVSNFHHYSLAAIGPSLFLCFRDRSCPKWSIISKI